MPMLTYMKRIELLNILVQFIELVQLGYCFNFGRSCYIKVL